ncbi:MAG: endonuclease/exonuclease/phosphatase family protein [Clostridiaceae bacterium]
MKIIEWNIRQGGGTRINQIIKDILNHDSDYYVLTEYRNNENGRKLIESMTENGYVQHFALQTDKNKNTVMIGSKHNFSAKVYNTELEDEYFRVIRIENEEIILYGAYFPQKNEKKRIFEFLLKEMALETTKPTLFIGDFNTGKPFADEVKNTFYCSQYMDAIEQRGYVDAWRFIHHDEREYTWYSNKGNGFRVDHAFINSNYKNNIVVCNYSHNERINKSSDHSLIAIEVATKI